MLEVCFACNRDKPGNRTTQPGCNVSTRLNVCAFYSGWPVLPTLAYDALVGSSSVHDSSPTTASPTVGSAECSCDAKLSTSMVVNLIDDNWEGIAWCVRTNDGRPDDRYILRRVRIKREITIEDNGDINTEKWGNTFATQSTICAQFISSNNTKNRVPSRISRVNRDALISLFPEAWGDRAFDNVA
ncbi:hypothetical protein OBBRIDRAFT_799108 [Obba rivulosa]|uniref:Uncharacterized protein n=1 Tax=Obba rivulosa TaxID=1052685 RepID=A0A8E2AH70_9APHY|nr:hypothetical protein OBBRIDRAFT_799108 [Obba rivulosa]